MKIFYLISNCILCVVLFNCSVFGEIKKNIHLISVSGLSPVPDKKVTDTLSNSKITGRVLDDHQKLQEYVTLTLIRSRDSSFVMNALSDSLGRYQFAMIKAGVYKVKATALGYRQMITPEFTLNSNTVLPLNDIVLVSLSQTLNEVKISGSRPLVETKRDRLVLNVENSPLASGNSLQLLKSAPFVQISANNNVTLQGKRTMILIDNKPVPDASLEDILLALPSGNILKVELITQPSAKYDATYGAVINITTKKSLMEGITGNVRTEGSMGLYGRADLNGQLTYRHKNLTLYGTGGLNRSDNLFQVSSQKILGTGNNPDVLANDSRRLANNKSYNFRVGADLALDKNQTIGVLINGNELHSNGPWPTVTSFSKQGGGIDSVLNTSSSFNLKLPTFTYSTNYHLIADSGKNELTFLATYTPFNRNLFQYFPSELLNSSGQILRTPAVYQTTNTSAINVYIAQLDYTHIFKHQWTIETGFKYQYTDSKSAVDYQVKNNNQFEHDPEFSSDNKLTEAISGAYAILSKDWKNDKLQAGIRVENTKADYAGNLSQNYFNAFPTLMYQHNFNSDYNLSLSFKRTINRAPYSELVPYTVFINQYNIEQGNPALKPEYDNVYTLSANIHKLSLSVSYTDANGMFALFPKSQDYATKVTYFSRQNLEKSSDLSLYLFYPLRLTSWWETQNSGTVLGYSRARGQILGSSYLLSSFRSDFRTAHIFTLSKNLKLQVDAYYWTPYTQDLSHYSGYKNIDAAFLLNIWEGRGQLRLSGSEIIFKRNDYHLNQNFNGYASREVYNTDSKRISLGFTYKFGKTTFKSTDRKLGNEDAVKRL